MGIPGQYDTELFHSTVAKIAAAAEKASVDGRKVFVGIGGLEPRPDLLEVLAKRHASVRYVYIPSFGSPFLHPRCGTTWMIRRTSHATANRES